MNGVRVSVRREKKHDEDTDLGKRKWRWTVCEFRTVSRRFPVRNSNGRVDSVSVKQSKNVNVSGNVERVSRTVLKRIY